MENESAMPPFFPQPSVFSGSAIETFITTRYGGVSSSPYSFFNCSPFVPDPASGQNRALLAGHLHAAEADFLIPHQVHGTRILCVDECFMRLGEASRRAELEGVDGLVTGLSGCFLCVTTADCLPVFFYDPVHRAVGIAHSGWRGTVAHISNLLLQAMQRRYHTDPREVRVAFGPCISGRHFEVGDEVYDAFSRAGFRMERLALHKMELTDEGECYFRWHISLQEAVVSDLAGMGVPEEQIERCPVCSYADHRCYSVRRQGPQTGRNLSGIRLV